MIIAFLIGVAFGTWGGRELLGALREMRRRPARHVAHPRRPACSHVRLIRPGPYDWSKEEDAHV